MYYVRYSGIILRVGLIEESRKQSECLVGCKQMIPLSLPNPSFNPKSVRLDTNEGRQALRNSSFSDDKDFCPTNGAWG